jgi:ATP-dependent helicase/nuclease subunit A
MASKKTPQPPDHTDRELITSELETTMLVEAAAGTGKTTAMIARMVALLAAGKCRTETLAAVTFTRKAAAELRARFQVALEKAVATAQEPSRTRLEEAVTSVERCFIGTIHSFCARLLRERPVEAGVDVGFQEMDEQGDARLRQQAWDQYVATLLATDAPILAELESLGLELGDLGPTFLKFCDYPDVEEWPATKVSLPDLEPARQQLRDYLRHMRQLWGTLPEAPGRDKLMPKYRSIPEVARYTDITTPAGLMAVLERFSELKDPDVVQKQWPGKRDQAKAELARWNAFASQIAQPLLQTWREHRYEPILRAIMPAGEQYDHLRQEAGSLNYQDLLMKAAALLRDKPQIRRYFRKRFTHLLVDEFQDTDPIQAEVMLLLTAESTTETDWWKCRPVHGSLFVVGDPKQSIYRFRRADIATYNRVRQIIEKSGGRVVALSANFRTLGPLVEWINGAFDQVFPAEATIHTPAKRPMLVGRDDGAVGELAGLWTLRIPQQYGNQADIAEYEADLVARTIRAAIREGRSVPRSAKELERGAKSEATAGDFMIITRQKSRLSIYGRKLQELGVPCQITGGTSLNEVDELRLLYTCLFAVTRPDDPVALVATLRSELFGISDADLYDFKRAGGVFSFHAAIPNGLKPPAADEFQDAFTRLRKYALWLAKLPPVSAIERVLADLGLPVMACTSASGTTQAGSLAKGIELLRQQQTGSWTAADLVEYLGQIVQLQEKHDGVSARPYDAPAVRIMNLHKTKGLEAPIVFLVDPSGESDHDVDLHIDRSGDRVHGYLAVCGEKQGWQTPLLAHPVGWARHAAEEQRFRDAENERLLYVAATRAGAMLTITQRDKKNQANPWQFFEPYMGECPLAADPGTQVADVSKPVSVTDRSVHDSVQAIQQRWETISRPTYATAAIKAISVDDGIPAATMGEHGTEWGTVIHLLLETVMRCPKADLQQITLSALADQGLAPGMAETAVQTVRQVMESAVWQRAQVSRRRLVEVPLQIQIPASMATATSVPLLLRGVIDLTFWEQEGWIIVDYKTDRVTSAKVPGLVEHYAGQLRTYADVWQKTVSSPVREIGLYFTHLGLYEKVPMSSPSRDMST